MSKGTPLTPEEASAETLPVAAVASAETVPAGDLGRVAGDDHAPRLPAVDAAFYEIGEEIGRGGIGRVLRGRDRRLERPVAIKELHQPYGAAAARFRREARITARLQHPGVVPVYEAGRWADTETTFYTMKLVDGRSLDQIVRETPSFEERIALVPRVLAVAEAVACAHSQRIIHRDLKPANILLGPFGETVVVDWGLAKDLAHELVDEPVAPEVAPRGEGATVAGAVMGTPGYMSPEQAAGLAVDERSDVYALGATLYHVLAGAPPFSGLETAQVLARVRANERPERLHRLEPRVPRELVDIVHKAMSPNPERRYPSAADVADDLRRFQNGKLVAAHEYRLREHVLRWLRRHRAVAAVLLLSALLLAAVATIAARRVVQARDAAQAQRDAAEELVSFMLGDLRRRLDGLGRLDVLESVGDRVGRYYGRVPAGSESAVALRRRAEAMLIVAVVEQRRGRSDAAAARAREADAVLARLPAGDLGAERLRLKRVVDLGQHDGDAATRRGVFAAALAHAGRLAAAHPEDPAWLTIYAQLATSLAYVDVNDSRTDQAIAVAEEALARIAPLAEAGPGHGSSFAELHNLIGAAEDASGHVEAAVAAFRAGLARLAGSGVESDGELRSAILRDLCLALYTSGDAGARAVCEEGVAVAEHLVCVEPSNSKRRATLAIVSVYAAYEASERGATAAARASQARAVEVFETLASEESGSTRNRTFLAAALLALGDTERKLGDATAAIASYRRSIAFGEDLARGPSPEVAVGENLALAHQKLGEILGVGGENAESMAELRLALVETGRTLARVPESVDAQEIAVDAESQLAEQLAKSDPAEALVLARRARDRAVRLAADEEGDLESRNRVVRAHRVVGLVAAASGDPVEARAAAAAAIAAARATLARIPDSQAVQGILAQLLIEQRTRASLEEAIAVLAALEAAGRLDADSRKQLEAARAARATLR